MLTGKCKIDFEEWYKDKYYLYVEGDCDSCGCGIGLPFGYDKLPETMQQGVLREFFESKGVWVNVTYRYDWKVYVPVVIFNEDGFYKDLLLQIDKNYSTAFTTAIDNAVEIYNGKEK